jgi:hypothetical protein
LAGQECSHCRRSLGSRFFCWKQRRSRLSTIVIEWQRILESEISPNIRPQRLGWWAESQCPASAAATNAR